MTLLPNETIIAVDPGKSGGIAVHEWGGSVEVTKMPDTLHDLFQILAKYQTSKQTTVYLEEVGGYVSGNPMPGSAAFRFGQNFGQVEMATVALGYKLVRVRPGQWMKAMSLGTRGTRTKSKWKSFLKGRAQEIYPNHGATLHTADALLILNAAVNGKI